ncbi:TKL/TKL-ccin protein kinase [Mycena indigotica]|uniref:TKL/TKL-ccin protein kinase n=1 Tax=Mycena indigotica TaxID=2126181 RepID=A0A8H6SL70_9AGAR|nr:TKL/TKL-ccin protein kinase [Mycena indigotica]KAF7301446.1 TKL/TKL-ccin protein kinase [Mycena indigotica]
MTLLLRTCFTRHTRTPLRLQSYSRRAYNSHRRPLFSFLDDIPQKAVFWTIIGLNGAVFGLSWWARQKLQVERDPRLMLWLQKNFYLSWKNLEAGRVWTLVTSMFTHSMTDISHILFNGFTFYFMAPMTMSILGNRQFLLLYIGGGIAADLWAMAYKKLFQNGRDPYTVGASAAIYSMMSFLACAAPRMTILVYGIIPVPIWLAVTGLFTYESSRTASDKGGTTDTLGHIGGMLAGAGYFLARRFRVL